MKQQFQRLHKKIINVMRIFNKKILNHIMLKLSETGRGPYTAIHHIGRCSGRTYRTPVFAYYDGNAIIIPLPYGDQVDWLRNILAQGGCEMIGDKSRITAASPQLLDQAAALAVLPTMRGKIFQLFSIEQFLSLQIVERDPILVPA
ncbi:MAG: hypothetical protein PVF49_11900 [Anaerolineales bacterium]|jgi:deazaflavin-dependent oxidoreductase (nitroreductase family)